MARNSKITLYKTDFDSSLRQVVHVANETIASQYVNSYPARTFTNCSWQRDNRSFRCPVGFNEAEQYNYLSFEQTLDGITQTMYGFITSFNYVNDGMTEVNFFIDPFMSFAGKWQIRKSPCKRQHPVTDNLGGNYFPEPIQINAWQTEHNGAGSGVQTPTIFLVTAVNARTYSGGALVDYWDSVGKLALGESYTSLRDYMQAIKTTPCNCSGLIQQNTSKTYYAAAQQILQEFAGVGREKDLLAVYKIPDYFLNNNILPGFDITDMDDFKTTLSLPLNQDTICHWNKMRYTSQFNRIIANLGGATKEYNIELVDINDIQNKSMTFDITASQSMSGQPILSPPINYATGQLFHAGEFNLAGPQWDLVQVSSVALNRATANQLERASLQSMINFGLTTAKTVSTALNVFDTNALEVGIGVAQGAANEAFATSERQDKRVENVQNSSISVGSNTQSWISYMNSGATAVRVTHYFPSQLMTAYCNNFFNMYGYNWNGVTIDINLLSMPFFNFIQTAGANIIAPSVPDEYIKMIRTAFDNGLFYFKDLSTFQTHFDNVDNNHY